MANPYYRSGDQLKAKNELAGGLAIDVPAFALGTVDLDRVRTALDVGCGWGRFARPLLQNASTIDLVCCDVWPGMVGSCRATLADAGLTAQFIIGDARALPVSEDSRDLVMANHMLYEFGEDELRVVIAELARVLTPTGTLLATTYSDAYPIPMTELHHETLAAIGFPYEQSPPSSFCLENGVSVLEQCFARVDTHVVDEVRSTTDAGEFTDLYLKTGGFDWASHDESIPKEARQQIARTFQSLAQQRIDRLGAITTITKWTAFVAREPW